MLRGECPSHGAKRGQVMLMKAFLSVYLSVVSGQGTAAAGVTLAGIRPTVGPPLLSHPASCFDDRWVLT